MNKTSLDEYKKQHNKELVSDLLIQKMNEVNKHRLIRKVYLKYLLMRVRTKISYMAMEQRITITELFVNACLKTYVVF